MTTNLRRAVRTTIHAIGAVAMLGMLAWVIHKTDKPTAIGMGLVLILLIRELFHGAENVVARVKFSAGTEGVDFEANPEGRGNA